MKKIFGLFGGAFDPFHQGHLHIALNLLNTLPLAKICFLPYHTPPHKKILRTSPYARVAMIKAAIQGYKGLEINTYEIDRSVTSYTIDTLKYLKKSNIKTAIALILSIETFSQLPTWKNFTKILNYAHIIVVPRVGYTLLKNNSDLHAIIRHHQIDQPSDLNKALSGYLYFLNSSCLHKPIASSTIRHYIQKNLSTESLLPSKVASYIKKYQLYQNKTLHCYRVGGAVRDKLMGIAAKEQDWVVLGETESSMKKLGYKQVGLSFPVFLHPSTQEEYALARTEKKIGKGYQGFECYSSPYTTLEQDLKRRDLTINAIAQCPITNTFIDPFNGLKDLKKKILKHVSLAFSEDPVRILRVARFAAKFPDFTLDSTTLQLMKHMANQGEVQALVAERVWKECHKALKEKQAIRFFQTLESCQAFLMIFGLPLSKFDLKLLDEIIKKTQNTTIRFAAFIQNLSIEEFNIVQKKLKLPKKYKHLAKITIRYKSKLNEALHLSPKNLIVLLQQVDAWRRPENLKALLLLGHTEDENQYQHNQGEIHVWNYLSKVLEATKNNKIPSQHAEKTPLSGKTIQAYIQYQREQQILQVKKNF